MVLSDNWTETPWDLWIWCGQNKALSCQEFSQSFILPILYKTSVSPTFLHFQKAIYCSASPFQTHLISLLCLFLSTTPHLGPRMCANHWSYLCSVLFSTPHLVKARLPGIKQSKLLFPPTHPTLAGEFMAMSSPLRQKLRGPCLSPFWNSAPSCLMHHLILSHFGHVRHHGVMPWTALFDTHSSAPAQSPEATARLWLFIFPLSQ